MFPLCIKQIWPLEPLQGASAVPQSDSAALTVELGEPSIAAEA